MVGCVGGIATKVVLLFSARQRQQSASNMSVNAVIHLPNARYLFPSANTAGVFWIRLGIVSSAELLALSMKSLLLGAPNARNRSLWFAPSGKKPLCYLVKVIFVAMRALLVGPTKIGAIWREC